jgi:cytochrome c oxidase subunit III
MASFTPTVTLEPQANIGRNGGAPPLLDGGDDGRSESGPPSFQVRLRRARLGLAVAITGIVMIFVSYSSAYFVRQGLPTLDVATGTLVHDWIPVRLPPLLLLNTLVLLLSTITMELARRQSSTFVGAQPCPERSRRNAAPHLGNPDPLKTDGAATIAAPGTVSLSKQGGEISWLTVTAVLGLAFLFGQWQAWRELSAAGFYLSATPSSSFVYLLTGMHAVHLIGGVIALLLAAAASPLRRPIASQMVLVDVTGWYWHFMAILWVYIFCLMKLAH